MKQLKRFYKLIWQRPWPFVAHVSLLLLATIAANLSPFFLAWLTESVSQAEYGRMFNLIWLFGASLLISNLLQNAAYYIQNKNLGLLSCQILHKIMTKIHQLDFAFHTNKSSGKLLSILNRGDDAVFVFYESINDELLIVVVGFLMMGASFAALDVKYLLIMLGFVAVAGVAGYFILRENMRKRKLFNREDDNLSAAKVDNLINFDTVKYFAKEKFEQKRLWQVLKKWFQTLQGYFVTFRLFDLIINNVVNIFIVVMGLLAWNDFRSGNFDGAQFIFVLTFATTVAPKMGSLMFIIRHAARKSDDLERYLGILDEKTTVPDPVNPQRIQNLPGIVQFHDVDFGYDQKKELALADFSLTIQPGEAVALVGFSGAGKTTVVKLLMRMYDVTAGSITIDNVDVRAMDKDYLRSLVSIVPQEPLLFNNTVSYNLAYSKPEATLTEIEAAAEAAQAADFIKNLTKGYETVVGERGIKLSGGQRQRLAIARVLLQGAQIVVFDEATSNLDSASEKAVQDAFWKMAKNPQKPVSSIIIAHRLSTIMKADKIVVMDEGRIAEIGTHRELLARQHSIYRKLWELQQDGFIGDGESGISG